MYDLEFGHATQCGKKLKLYGGMNLTVVDRNFPNPTVDPSCAAYNREFVLYYPRIRALTKFGFVLKVCFHNKSSQLSSKIHDTEY